MKDNFIQINGRILDYGRYKADFERYSGIIRTDIKERLRLLGFVIDGTECKNSVQSMKFYNSELDIEVSVDLKKRTKPDFV